jgi:hypothetical protein
VLPAAPLRAEVARVDTPQGLARVEGGAAEGGQRLVVGDRVALAAEEFPVLWIEAERGSLLPVGLGSGGTACPALWTWLDAGDPGFRRTEAFGTCSDLAAVTSDAGTVTVTLPSLDGNRPGSAFVWDGKGEVVEVPQGQEPSGMEPGDPDAWVGGCALDLFRASDRRGQLESMMGPEAYREAQEVGGLCAPMERRGEWVVGTAIGQREDSGFTVAVALGSWGAMAVGIRRSDGSTETWGGDSPELLAALAEGGWGGA